MSMDEADDEDAPEEACYDVVEGHGRNGEMTLSSWVLIDDVKDDGESALDRRLY